jgi:hypothetical protein
MFLLYVLALHCAIMTDTVKLAPRLHKSFMLL